MGGEPIAPLFCPDRCITKMLYFYTEIHITISFVSCISSLISLSPTSVGGENKFDTFLKQKIVDAALTAFGKRIGSWINILSSV